MIQILLVIMTMTKMSKACDNIEVVFASIVEQIIASVLSTNFFREVKNVSLNFKQIAWRWSRL